MAKLTYLGGLASGNITSVIIRMFLRNITLPGNTGLTGLTGATSGLLISTIGDVESTAVPYVAGTSIDSIANLGTYSAPTAGHCRFREVDSVNHPGLYEFQFADARWSISGARSIVLTVTGPSPIDQQNAELQLYPVPGDIRLVGGAVPPAPSAGTPAGVLVVDTEYITGLVPTPVTALNTNLTQVNGINIPTSNVPGVLVVDAGYWKGIVPNSLVTGRMDSSVGALPNGTITTTSFAAGAINATVAPNLDTNVGSRMATFNLPTNFNLLGISGTGQVGLDFSNIKQATAPTTLTNITIPLVTTTTTATNATVVGYAANQSPTDALNNQGFTTVVVAYIASNLNVGGRVASQADVQAIATSTSQLARAYPSNMLIPGSGSQSYILNLFTKDSSGHSVNADSLPTITATDQNNVSLNSHLSAFVNISTGFYQATYTVNSTDTPVSVYFTTTAVISASTFIVPDTSQVSTSSSVQFSASDRANIQATVTATQSLTYTGSNVNAIVETYAPGQSPAIQVIGGGHIIATDGSGFISVNNFPTDYQQRGVAVTLPNTLPGGSISTSTFQNGTTMPRVSLVDTVTSVTNPVLLPTIVPPGYGGGGLLHTGIAQGGFINRITLDSSASPVPQTYRYATINTTGGTGAEQTGYINDYSGTPNFIATITTDWATIPDATTEFEIIGLGAVLLGNLGPGPRTINQDYNGTGSLRLLDTALEPIAGGSVVAYLSANYATQGTSAPVLAQTVTDAAGNWTLTGLGPASYAIVFTYGSQMDVLDPLIVN